MHNWCSIQHQTWRWEHVTAFVRHARRRVRQRRWRHSSVRAAAIHCNHAAIHARPRATPYPWCMCLCWVYQHAPVIVQHVVHRVKVMRMCLTIAVDGDAEHEGVDDRSSVDVTWVIPEGRRTQRMVDGKQHPLIEDRPHVWMPLLMTTMSIATAMVTEMVVVAVVTKTMAATQRPNRL